MKNKGFTILELLVTIFIISIGILGASAAINKTMSLTSNYSSKLIAVSLAQEGIEIVRNIRDGNFLEQRASPATPWNDGFVTPGDYEADYTMADGLDNWTNRYLKTNSNGFYFYSDNPIYSETKFKRKITISEIADIIDPNSRAILVEVSWLEKGDTKTITAKEYLCNWE
ncbi:prepilin-type N-terminal cleavage/methylation domain-containing protein [Candidatus Parcubacteria bacterium]|nr:prepilin-type N-terminal cleavage/methylation domain-containing protein [Candidatus Parcubacteria bacterium]